MCHKPGKTLQEVVIVKDCKERISLITIMCDMCAPRQGWHPLSEPAIIPSNSPIVDAAANWGVPPECANESDATPHRSVVVCLGPGHIPQITLKEAAISAGLFAMLRTENIMSLAALANKLYQPDNAQKIFQSRMALYIEL